MAEEKTRKQFGVIHRNPKLALSIFGPPRDESFEHRDYVELPFGFIDAGRSAEGGSCGGWLYFYNAYCEIVIWNMSIDVHAFLPQPILDKGRVMATGMGYVAASGDYMFMRYYHHYRITTYPGGPRMLDGISNHFEVCSFRLRGDPRPPLITSWREILGYDTKVSSIYGAGVYVTDTSYHNFISTKCR